VPWFQRHFCTQLPTLPHSALGEQRLLHHSAVPGSDQTRAMPCDTQLEPLRSRAHRADFEGESSIEVLVQRVLLSAVQFQGLHGPAHLHSGIGLQHDSSASLAIFNSGWRRMKN